MIRLSATLRPAMRRQCAAWLAQERQARARGFTDQAEALAGYIRAVCSAYDLESPYEMEQEK